MFFFLLFFSDGKSTLSLVRQIIELRKRKEYTESLCSRIIHRTRKEEDGHLFRVSIHDLCDARVNFEGGGVSVAGESGTVEESVDVSKKEEENDGGKVHGGGDDDDDDDEEEGEDGDGDDDEDSTRKISIQMRKKKKKKRKRMMMMTKTRTTLGTTRVMTLPQRAIQHQQKARAESSKRGRNEHAARF